MVVDKDIGPREKWDENKELNSEESPQTLKAYLSNPLLVIQLFLSECESIIRPLHATLRVFIMHQLFMIISATNPHISTRENRVLSCYIYVVLQVSKLFKLDRYCSFRTHRSHTVS